MFGITKKDNKYFVEIGGGTEIITKSFWKALDIRIFGF